MKKLEIRHYIIVTYLSFWLMVLVLCGGASMVFHAPPLVMRILADVCAWSPTLVLLIMWKRLRPEQTRRDFIAACFSGELVWYLLPLLVVLISGGVICSVYLLSLLEHRTFSSYFSMGGWSLMASLLLSLFSGSTGEELGWRGYLREELAKRYPFTKAALIQGVIWTFWHTILWFVDSDFTGWKLMLYMLANLIVMTCLAYIMNVILDKHNNLAYSILIHFSFNFPYCFLNVDIWFYIVLSILFLLLAAGFCRMRKRFQKAAAKEEKLKKIAKFNKEGPRFVRRKMMKDLVLYIHGNGGSAAESEHYKPLFPDCEVKGLDYQTFTPWETGKEIRKAVEKLKGEYESITLIANSIGAFFSMNAGIDAMVQKAYFISPIVDMERLICDMMLWANVTEKELQAKGVIPTSFGEDLSWDYLCYVREHPVQWRVPTDILYGRNDNLTSYETITAFAKAHRASLTVMEHGEHWFHTEEQMRFLDEWIEMERTQ